jgi:hypothetical protein
MKMDNFTEYSQSGVEPKLVFFPFSPTSSTCDFYNQGFKGRAFFARYDPVVLDLDQGHKCGPGQEA